MKTRIKIAIVVIPFMVVGIVLVNLIFGMFFRDHVLRHEQEQLHAATASIASYLSERNAKYAGSVNDWGHWDDTNHFMQTLDSAYVDLNMTESSYQNLDLSFIIIADASGAIVYHQHYDRVGEVFQTAPAGFSEEISSLTAFARAAEDTSGILKIGDEYYFCASTVITDSLEQQAAGGILIFGRVVDDSIVTEMEKISGGSIREIRNAETQEMPGQDSEVSILSQEYTDDESPLILAQLGVPNVYDRSESLIISIDVPRTLYVSGMKEITDFSVFTTISIILVSVFLFLLLGKYLTVPFERLLADVKTIDVTGRISARIPEGGTDEFSYLRKSINALLARIETVQSELVESREKLEATLISVGDGVITVDSNGLIQFLNPVAQKLSGWTLDEAAGLPLENVFRIINEYTRQPVDSPVQAVYKSGEIIELANHTLLLAKDGSEIPIEDTAAPIRDSQGQIIGCVLVFRDYSERKEKQRRIEYLSYHDHLTGLYNRRYFEEELKRIDTDANMPLSFVYADVDGLKMINDAFGHDRGDELICNVAETLKEECRPDDVITRVGGDEFVVLMPRTEASEAEALFRRIEEHLSLQHIEDVPITISYGGATKERAEQSAREILKQAESAMYDDKSAGHSIQ